MNKFINITVGLENFINTAWSHNFYPDDLPEDWTLDFYGNEFSSLLINDKCFNDKGVCDGKLDKQIEYVFDMLDDSFCENFNLFLPQSWQAIIDGFVDKNIGFNEGGELQIDYYRKFEEYDDFEGLSYHEMFQQDGTALILFKVNVTEQLAPKALKKLLDTCLRFGESKQNNSLYLFFSDTKNAVVNAGNLRTLFDMI